MKCDSSQILQTGWDSDLKADFAVEITTIREHTETEIRANLAEHIMAFAQQKGISIEVFLNRMRQWYDGFCFAPEAENVYNLFSTLLLFYHQRFSNYWFESDTPTFLINLIKEGKRL